MKVNGEQIPDAAIDAGLAAMKRQLGFQLYHIASVIEKQLTIVDRFHRGDTAGRAADRLIQRERKAGNIGPLNPSHKRSSYWRWIGGKQ